MRIRLTLFLLSLLASLGVRAQFDLGGMAGTCLYQGDITNNMIGHASFAMGGVLRYNLNPYMAVRTGISYGNISGDDKDAKDESRRNRNLSFKSPVLEISLIGDIIQVHAGAFPEWFVQNGPLMLSVGFLILCSARLPLIKV